MRLIVGCVVVLVLCGAGGYVWQAQKSVEGETCAGSDDCQWGLRCRDHTCYEPIGEKGTVEQAKIRMEEIADAAMSYYATYGTYPSQAQGLRALVDPPTGQPLLKGSQLKDPWGNQYLYREAKGVEFELISKGPDEMEGTADDLAHSPR